MANVRQTINSLRNKRALKIKTLAPSINSRQGGSYQRNKSVQGHVTTQSAYSRKSGEQSVFNPAAIPEAWAPSR